MKGPERLRALEVAHRLGGNARPMSDYWEAIHRTNVTGLASLRDYELAFGPLAMETREWLCAQAPLLATIDRLYGPVRGAPAASIHPPGDPLPEEMREDLRRLEDAVTATGTQVLESRESDDPDLAAEFSVHKRQEYAILHLALGDAEGSVVRELVWKRHKTVWRHTRYALELAATKGLSRREYEALCVFLSPHLPAADDPAVLAKVDARRSATSSGKERRRPWITFAEIRDFLESRRLPNSQSDPVRSGQGDQGGNW